MSSKIAPKLILLTGFLVAQTNVIASDFSTYDFSKYGTPTTGFWLDNYYKTLPTDNPSSTWVTHTGVDYNIGDNASHVPIYSYGFGKIIYTGGGTNAVTVRHLLDIGKYVNVNLLHLNSISVTRNSFLAKNQIIGREGNTGLGFSNPETNTHLHFEIAGQISLAWVPTASACPANGCRTAERATAYDIGDLTAHYHATTNSPGVPYNGRVWYSPDTFRAHSEAIPFISRSSNPSSANYDVYGVVNKLIYGSLNLRGSFLNSAIVVRNNSNRQNVESRDVNFDDAHTFLGGSHNNQSVNGIVGSGIYQTSGDYLFAAYANEANQLRFGYPVKLSVVNEGDIIVDNDQLNNGTPAYYGTSGEKSPGYFMTADLHKGKSTAIAQWKPNTGNTYSIYVHIPESGATATNVIYKIKADGINTIYSLPVNQSAHPNEWVKLVSATTDQFVFSNSGYVGLSLDSEATGQNYPISSSSSVAFDAVKFERVGTGTGTGTANAAEQRMNKCISNFSAYFGSKSGSVYSCGGNYVCQQTTGTSIAPGLNYIAIDKDLSQSYFWYYWGGWSTLDLNHCN